MWQVVGIDRDGERHVWTICDNEETAKQKAELAKAGLKRMQSGYADSLIKAVKEYREIKRMLLRKRPKYYDYMGWKMQGFFIKEFRIEEVVI